MNEDGGERAGRFGEGVVAWPVAGYAVDMLATDKMSVVQRVRPARRLNKHAGSR